ncbi:MAG: MFS transporter [Syntrophobacteraceae bacterium]
MGSELDIPAAKSWASGLTKKHWNILFASFLGWVFDGYESYALIVVMPFALKGLLLPDQLSSMPLWAGIAIGITLLGWGAGGVVGGVLADYIGRKRMMLISVFLYAMFSGLTALVHSFAALVFLRFVTGLAMGSEWSTGVTLLAETWPDRARPKGAGFLQSGFGWGTFLAAFVWMILGAWQPLGAETWRLMFLFGALPALFLLYIRRSIDESEKWLLAVKNIRWTTVGGAAGERRPFTLAQIFKDPSSRKRTLLAFLLSLCTTVGWWAISSWLPALAVSFAKTQGMENPAVWGARVALLYTARAVLAYMVSGFLADWMGRRRFLFMTYAGALASTPLTYLWPGSVEQLMLVAGLSGFFTLGCAYAWMAIYPAELFPSLVRSSAASFIFNAARLIAWVFPIIAGTLIGYFGSIPKAAMILSSIYILGLIVPWSMPETRGKPLPE